MSEPIAQRDMTQPFLSRAGRQSLGTEAPIHEATVNGLGKKALSNLSDEQPDSYAAYPIEPKTQIRILNLLPASSSDPDNLHCTLLAAKLEDKPTYEALSYVWGEPVFSERLYLPSGYLKITTNLASALRHLRYRDSTRRLWIDAICINQQDHAEKGHQVSLMAQVYAGTGCVLAWLGEGDVETRLAFAVIKDIYANEALGFSIHSGVNVELLRILDDEQKVALQPYIKEPNISALTKFIKMPWFHRLWIVQEVVLPPRLKVFLGNDFLGFDELRSFAKFLMQLFAMDNVTAPGIVANSEKAKSVVFTCGLRDTFQQAPQALDALICVNNFSDRACENDLDRIYGLMGLFPHTLNPDYGKSVERVYLDFAYANLGSGKLDILHNASRLLKSHMTSHANSSPSPQSFDPLPTWVPDWRAIRPNAVFDENFRSATELPASKFLDESLFPFIGIRGVRLDVVRTVISAPKCDRENQSCGDAWKAGSWKIMAFEKLFLETMASSLYPNGEDPQVAFARTMVLDNRRSSERRHLSPELTPQDLHALWKDLKDGSPNYDLKPRADMVGVTKVAQSDFRSYRNALLDVGRLWSPFVSSAGYIGFGPKSMQMNNDIVVIFDGDATPFILRRATPSQSSTKLWAAKTVKQQFVPDEQWELVGDCYVHGFMDNEVARPEYREKAETFWIT